MRSIQAESSSEELRLQSLRNYAIMDTPEEASFDNLVTLAARICEVPFAQINFLDEKRTWSKAKYGIPMRELPRSSSFCDQTIRERERLIVKDASKDDRFRNFPFVAEEPHIRFYAGYNIKDEVDRNLGTICVLDTHSKKLSEKQQEALDTLAREVEARIQLHKKNQELHTLSRFLESATDLLIVVDPETEIVLRSSDNVGSFFSVHSPKAVKKLEQLIPDPSFIELLREWKEDGEKGNIHPVAAVKDPEGKMIYLEITVRKDGDKWYMSAKNVSEQVAYQKRLEGLLDEKNILLGEVHHRVKNNLAVISGILQLEEFKSDSAEVQQVLHNNYMRVRSMSLIHEEMYREKNYTSIRFDRYLEGFADGLRTDSRATDHNISISWDLDPVLLNLNQAIPCALIVNELVSNAFTFAFKDMSEGSISLSLKKQEDGNVILAVRDSGVGLPDDFDLHESPTLGTTLITSYSQQLRSEIAFNSNEGTEFCIAFRPDKDAVGSSASQLHL